MALDPAISLAIKPPNIENPIESVTKAVALRDMMSQAAFRTQQILTSQQQMANLQAEQQQRNRDLQDENTISKLHFDPNFQDAYARGDVKTVNDMLGGVQEKYRSPLLDNSQKLLIAANGIADNKLKRIGELHTDATNVLASVDTDHIDDQTIPRLKASLNSLKQDYPDLADKLPDTSNLTKDNLAESIKNFGAGLRITEQMVKNQYALREAKANTEEKETAADLAAKTEGSKITQAAGQAQEATEKGKQATAQTPVIQAVAQATLHDPKLLNPQQRAQNDIEWARLANDNTRTGLEVKKYAAEYGGNAISGWAKNVLVNPDSVGEIPAPIKSAVMQELQKQGYMMPKAADATSRTTEIAANNALIGANFIQRALQNPEIRQNIGPIMGRLGNAEQAVGTAPNLSPEATRIAQELRTRMRYFVFQEGKQLLSGRIPQNLMKELETSSASPHMNADMLQGALDGAVGSAKSNLDNIDAQRFGGKARPRVLRGLDPGYTIAAPDGHAISTDDNGKTWYDTKTGDPITPKK